MEVTASSRKASTPPAEKQVWARNESPCLTPNESVPFAQLLHLHITSEITQCAESSEGEIGAERRRGNFQKNNFQFFSNIASFMDVNSAGSHAGNGCYLVNFHSH